MCISQVVNSICIAFQFEPRLWRQTCCQTALDTLSDALQPLSVALDPELSQNKVCPYWSNLFIADQGYYLGSKGALWWKSLTATA